MKLRTNKTRISFRPFNPCRPTRIPLQTVQIQMRRLVTSHLVRIHTVCHPFFYLRQPLFSSMFMSKFKVLVLLFVALWFILRGDLLYVFPCVILFLCFSVLLVLRLPRLGKRELILVLFVRLFGLCLFRFVGFLFLCGRAAVCDCGTPWTFLLPFFLKKGRKSPL